jgi:hypothetical protein
MLVVHAAANSVETFGYWEKCSSGSKGRDECRFDTAPSLPGVLRDLALLPAPKLSEPILNDKEGRLH